MKSLLDFVSEVVGVLDATSVPYMVTGSIASTYYAEPRTTLDLDIVVSAPVDAIQTFADAFDTERYYVGDARRAAEMLDQFNVIDLESSWKLDVVVRKDRPFSVSEFGRRVRVEFAGIPVYVATVEDMILAKLEWSKLGESERQLRDVEAMIRINADSLDREYLDTWSAQLGVDQMLAGLLRDVG